MKGHIGDTNNNDNNRYKIRLDLFFNFIISGGKKFFEDFERILNILDKQAIIIILKKLNIFIDDPNKVSFVPENKLDDIKILYWVVKEIYFSSYKVYLNDLDYKTLYLKFLQAKKYISNDEDYDVKRVIGYTIKCLQKVFENKKIGGEIV